MTTKIRAEGNGQMLRLRRSRRWPRRLAAETFPHERWILLPLISFKPGA